MLNLGYIAFSTLSETPERYPGFPPPNCISAAKQAAAEPDLSTFYLYVCICIFIFLYLYLYFYIFVFVFLYFCICIFYPNCISAAKQATAKPDLSTFEFLFIFTCISFTNLLLNPVMGTFVKQASTKQDSSTCRFIFTVSGAKHAMVAMHKIKYF